MAPATPAQENSGRWVRITVRLLRAVTGEQLWAEEYEDDVGDILRLQAGVAQKIASAIKYAQPPKTNSGR